MCIIIAVVVVVIIVVVVGKLYFLITLFNALFNVLNALSVRGGIATES